MAESTANSEAQKTDELVDKLKGIKLRLRQDLANLQRKLEGLDLKPELLGSLESLKKDAESRAGSLENEVKQLALRA